MPGFIPGNRKHKSFKVRVVLASYPASGRKPMTRPWSDLWIFGCWTRNLLAAISVLVPLQLLQASFVVPLFSVGISFPCQIFIPDYSFCSHVLPHDTFLPLVFWFSCVVFWHVSLGEQQYWWYWLVPSCSTTRILLCSRFLWLSAIWPQWAVTSCNQVLQEAKIRDLYTMLICK